MKIKYLFICFILVSATPDIDAQINKEIKAFVDSTELIVNNGSKMLEAKIIENDFVKGREIYDYHTEITAGKTYSALDYIGTCIWVRGILIISLLTSFNTIIPEL